MSGEARSINPMLLTLTANLTEIYIVLVIKPTPLGTAAVVTGADQEMASLPAGKPQEGEGSIR